MESADIGRSLRRVETKQITIEDVIRAGRTLFGPAFAVEAGAWRAALKETYRRRAMETHPDRASALGRREAELAREFRAVVDAYRVLSAIRVGLLPARAAAAAAPGPRPAPAQNGPVRTRPAPPPPPAPARGEPLRPPVSAGAPHVRASVRPEALPRRRLRFAEYLYYSGRVRWSELVEAIAWQRAQRPPIGRIAVGLGYLAHDDVGVILERRRLAGANAILFGEWAVRLGYLTPFQVLAILGQQLRRQRPIGQYFVERGMLGPDDVEEIRRRILRHNTHHEQ